MGNRIILIFTLLLLVLPVASARQNEIDGVCLVTDIGRVDDGTFNQYTYEGMVRAVEDFDLDSDFIETTAQTDYEKNINYCLQEGYDIIITIGYLLADATREAALNYPDRYFIGIDQDVFDGDKEQPANWVGIQAREDQAGYIVGVLAALVSESKIVGGVFGDAIPPVVRFRNGYEQGIRSIDPTIEILGVYIDDFNAPDRGASAALQFIGEGADVIFGCGGPTGSGGILAAAQKDTYVIGVDQDEFFTTFNEGETPGAEFLVSSAIKRVDVGVYNMIEALVTGNMDEFLGGNNYVLDVANGGIDFAGPNESDIPEEIYEQVAEIKDKLASGELQTGVDPITGEILEEAAPSDS